MFDTAMKIIHELPNKSVWIDNKWVSYMDYKSRNIINPTKGEKLKECIDSNKEIVDSAVISSERALKEWSGTAPSVRGNLLYKIAQEAKKHSLELAAIESINNGKLIKDAIDVDLTEVINTFEYYAGLVKQNRGEVIPNDSHCINFTLKQPVGIVGAIIPWNYPLIMLAWKVAPALAAGNCVVLKPSEYTPLSAMYFMELMKSAGLHDGVVNMITGDGTTGDFMSHHNKINKIAFTGSRATASKIIKASADSNLKRVSLELGGKSPNIVLKDAKIDNLIDDIFWGIFFNKGEVCAAGSRLIIHKSLHDEVVEKLVEKTRQMVVGDPFNENSQMGSLISESQMNKVLSYIEKGKAEGAKLLVGGKRLLDHPFDKGFFVEPTIFDDVTKDMAIAKEEIFGPVLSILTFEDEDEAINIANSTIYGLVGAVWTEDVSRAIDIAEKIESGIVWINKFSVFDSASPFGGFKQSGWGREKGLQVLDSYTELKSIWLPR